MGQIDFEGAVGEQVLQGFGDSPVGERFAGGRGVAAAQFLRGSGIDGEGKQCFPLFGAKQFGAVEQDRPGDRVEFRQRPQHGGGGEREEALPRFPEGRVGPTCFLLVVGSALVQIGFEFGRKRCSILGESACVAGEMIDDRVSGFAAGRQSAIDAVRGKRVAGDGRVADGQPVRADEFVQTLRRRAANDGSFGQGRWRQAFGDVPSLL